MIQKKHLQYITYWGRVGLRVTNLAGLHEVYSKTTYFKFQAHVTYETLKSSKEMLILDASSKRGSDAQPFSANVKQCSLTWLAGDRKVDTRGHLHFLKSVASETSRTAHKFIPPHKYVPDVMTPLTQECILKASAQHTWCPKILINAKYLWEKHIQQYQKQHLV